MFRRVKKPFPRQAKVLFYSPAKIVTSSKKYLCLNMPIYCCLTKKINSFTNILFIFINPAEIFFLPLKKSFFCKIIIIFYISRKRFICNLNIFIIWNDHRCLGEKPYMILLLLTIISFLV